MQEMLVHPPRTIMEVFKMLPEGTRAEVIEQTLYMSPTPITSHQRILRKLSTQIDILVTENNLGEIFFSPYDVFLDETENAVQPDLLFVSAENSHIIDDNSTIHGVPDLIIEILSPGNKKHDLVVKKNLYEKFGVKEYWIVNPETNEAIGFFLEGNSYQQFSTERNRINSRLLKSVFTF